MKDSALYLEVDEDITSAIDKLQKLPGYAAQVVVPKRSTMLQSIINLKLLKKAAADSGKELVLVTNDRIATDLAGRVGLAVAPSLGAMATVPESAVVAPVSVDEVIEADEPILPIPTPVPEAVAGDEANKSFFKRPSFAKRPISDAPLTPSGPEALAAGEDVPKPAGPKVPNFNKLQRRLWWAGGAVALIVAYMVTMYFVASAKVTLFAIGNKVDIDLSFTADPNLKQTDTEKGVLAAQAVTVSKDLSGAITPTGKKDVGTKAGGTMTVSNGTGVDQVLVAGTRFAAPDGQIFRSNQDVTAPAAHLNAGGDKVNGQAAVDVTADQAGDSYNEAPVAYAIPALNNAKITAQGGQMSGGTSKTITVVTAADIDKAKASLLDQDKDSGQRSLDGRVPSGYMGLDSSRQQTADSVASNPAVDQEASTATLTLKVTYTELTVRQSEYQDLVRAREQKQIGDKNQIYQDGLAAAQIALTAQDTTDRADFHLTTQASGGAKIDQAALAKQLAGKRYGDAADTASKQAGVQRAEISLWPVWSTSLPQRANQIKVTIQVAEAASK